MSGPGARAGSPRPAPASAPAPAPGAEPGARRMPRREEVESEPEGWGAREFPPLEVASPGPTVPSSLPPGALDAEVEDGEGPAGLASAHRPLPATRVAAAETHASAAGGQVRTRRGPSGGGGRPRPWQL